MIRWTRVLPALGALLTAVVTAFAGAPAAAMATGGSSPYVLDAHVFGDDRNVRFVADLSVPVDASVFTLADPYRIVIDMPEVHFAMPEDAGKAGRGAMAAFRYGDIAKGRSRIVIDLTGPVEIDKQYVTPPADNQPARLVVATVPTTREKFLAVSKAYRDAHGDVVDDGDSGIAGGGESTKPLIVLDPGHGGIDAGANGPDGALEKNVVLSFAKVLGDALVASKHYRVVYTRNDDTFLSLGERVKIARDRDAALFVSVHANSFPGEAVRGMIVYTASDGASDKMAEALAASENASDVLAGVDLTGDDTDEVKNILFDLTRRETRNFGVVFAQNLVRYLSQTTRMFKIPHQEAGFKVLEAPDVPSALIELGYLSTPADEQLLTSKDWQNTVASSMLQAIDAYFAGRTVDAAAGASIATGSIQ